MFRKRAVNLQKKKKENGNEMEKRDDRDDLA
jgi:hypothetical protein